MGFHRISIIGGGALLALIVGIALNAGNIKGGKEPVKSVSPPLLPLDTKNVKVPSKAESDKLNQKKDDAGDEKVDEGILRRAELSTEDAELIRFLQKRSVSDAEYPVIERLVRQLGSADYRAREKAYLALTTRGVAVLGVLRANHVAVVDLEMKKRIELATQQIHRKDIAPEVPGAVIRVLARRSPPGLVETLIDYLPFADNDDVLTEARAALLQHALRDGKIQPRLLSALTDRVPIRRAVAGEVLARRAYAQNKEPVRKLLSDPDAFVRFRVAQALAYARERDAIPVLIDAIPNLSPNAAWQVEDYLLQLAAGASPPEVALANDKDTREKCRAAWQEWWKKHGEKVDLAKIEEPSKLLGRTLVVLLDEKKVVELGRDNQPRWEIRDLHLPLDVQLIDEERVLIAEFEINRVSERNTRGEILRQIHVASPLSVHRLPHGPVAAQRLPNGNTFVATNTQFLEYDKNGREVINVSLAEEGSAILKAMKLPNGEIAAMLADGRFARFDAKGQVLHSFPIALGMRLTGGRVHVLPTGRILIPHNAEGKVTEYDAKGKVVWEFACEQPIAATRLPNGNTLITSMNTAIGAIEVDRMGTEVWSYRSTKRVTRAIRR